MGLKVIGAGLGRTGTHSLKLALERLTGEPCYHMVEVFQHMDHCPIWTDAANGAMPDWNSFLAGYGSAVDWPSAAFWKEMSDAIPEAIVVLSIRDANEWWESASSTIFPSMKHQPDPKWIFNNRTKMDKTNAAACIAEFNRHNTEVIASVPPERLVIWNAKDGWEPLCTALGVALPDEPFPLTNTRTEFIQRVNERSRQAETEH